MPGRRRAPTSAATLPTGRSSTSSGSIRTFATWQHGHRALAPALDDVADVLLTTGACLVHGDFSPKNLLVTPDSRLLLVDHEVAHWGHPAFDVGFVVSHLCLKAIRFRAAGHAGVYLDAAAAVLDAYAEEVGELRIGLGPFAVRVTGALLLARVDGKSPVEYLTGESDRAMARALGGEALIDPPSDQQALVERVRTVLAVSEGAAGRAGPTCGSRAWSRGRSSTRAAGRPSRQMSSWRTGSSAGARSRPGHRRERMRLSSSATATRRDTAVLASVGPSPTSIDIIGPAVRGLAADDQAVLDGRLIELDGTPTKARLGANAMLAVSQAACRAAAAGRDVPLYRHIAHLCRTRPVVPLPMVNLISGGLHAGRQIDFQDVLIIPTGAADFASAIADAAAGSCPTRRDGRRCRAATSRRR